ncbi:MAG: DUF4189 domain-containing protein [Mycobacterium sp.]
MTTIHKRPAGRLRRHAVAALLVAVGTTVASVLGATPTASALDSTVAIAVGLAPNTQIPVQTIGGSAVDSNPEQARFRALSNCESNGGEHCTLHASEVNTCAAAASNDVGEIKAGTDPNRGAAEQKALSALPNQQGAHIVISECTAPQAEPQPPAPLQGPTVSFEPIVGGLMAHITDRSGVTSQCTYTAENFNRSFALEANSTYDLKIVPAIPRFRNWDVTITCDNGTTTKATTYF